MSTAKASTSIAIESIAEELSSKLFSLSAWLQAGEGYVSVFLAAKSLQSCPTLCDPIDSSPSGFTIPGILQARTLEWVAISFSNAWKWKVKVKSLSRVRLLGTPWTTAYQAPPSMGFSRQEYWSGVPLPHQVSSKGFLYSFFTPNIEYGPKMGEVKVSQSCPTLCGPIDHTVHGILQVRILEWVAFPFSRGSFQLRDWIQVSCTAGRFFFFFFAGRFFTSWDTRDTQQNWSG